MCSTTSARFLLIAAEESKGNVFRVTREAQVAGLTEWAACHCTCHVLVATVCCLVYVRFDRSKSLVFLGCSYDSNVCTIYGKSCVSRKCW